jgi:hypothetical protein
MSSMSSNALGGFGANMQAREINADNAPNIAAFHEAAQKFRRSQFTRLR